MLCEAEKRFRRVKGSPAMASLVDALRGDGAVGARGAQGVKCCLAACRVSTTTATCPGGVSSFFIDPGARHLVVETAPSEWIQHS